MPTLPSPTFRNRQDIADFAATPLDERLQGRDVVTMIRDAATEKEDAIAIAYYASGKTDIAPTLSTRGDVIRGAAAFSSRLSSQGIQHGDVVASLLTNGPGTLSAAIGTLSLATLAPINIFLEAGQIRKLLQQSGARTVLVPREIPPALSAMFSTLRQICEEEPFNFLDVDAATIEIPEDPRILASRDLSDMVALFHTGGTTGLPKFVPLTARNLAAGAIISQFAYGYNQNDRILCAMPMFHVGGLFACSLYALCSGANVSVLGPLGYRGEGVIAALPRTIIGTEASVVVGPPTVMALLANAPPEIGKAKPLRLFVNGAAALPRVLGERLSTRTGVPVVEPWGLTEATLAVTSGPRDGSRKQGSVGLALPYCSVKAVRTDASDKYAGDCNIDEIGVLAIKGPMVFDGYLNRGTDQQPFFDDHWLDTGDLGRVDADGFVWVTGRAKELIKRGGHGIDPGMIEDALLDHDAVALVAAVGRPDTYAGEIPVAYVQLKPGATAEPEALISFARDRIPERAAVPKDIIIIDKLPLTAIGKVHKQTLKIDITRRVAETAVREATGQSADIAVSAEADPLHGLIVRARVPHDAIDNVRKQLSAFAFRSEITAIKKD